MQKGQPPEEVMIDLTTIAQMYIDQDDVAMCKVYKIENGLRVFGKPVVISMGPVTQIVGSKLPGDGRLAVAYLKINGAAYVRKGLYANDHVCWEKEMGEEECWVAESWPLTN